MLHPAVIDVSAWWGQYESIYLLFALAAVVFAMQRPQRAGRGARWRSALMTKPQALPFILPFAAWFWAHGGWREIVRTGAIGLAVIVVLWLPFIPAGGPLDYLAQPGRLPERDLPDPVAQAWNLWWLVQIAAVGGFASDQVAVIGPITLRHVGFVADRPAGARRGARSSSATRRPRTLILGLAASTLIWFGFLTQMHERYAYGALIFLLLLIPERRIQLAVPRVRRRVHAQPLVRGAAGADLPDVASVPGCPQPRRGRGDDRDHRRGVPVAEHRAPRTTGRPGPSGRGRRRGRLAIVRP